MKQSAREMINGLCKMFFLEESWKSFDYLPILNPDFLS